MFFDGEDECDPEGEESRIGGHGAVGRGEALDDPGSGALFEAGKEGFASGHEVMELGLWEREIVLDILYGFYTSNHVAVE